MSSVIYLVTGAAGFLGSHVCDELLERGDRVRALVLPGDKSVKYVPKAVEIVEGNLCDVDSLETFFTVPDGCESIVIHCASMVTTNPDFNQKLIDVNVGGTLNMIEKCLSHPECRKMVYVSSTGAIPELPKGTPIKETDKFTPVDEAKQVGCYSQSKAMATQDVLDACRERGLKACVVHPSGILGPKDYAVSETTGTIIKIMNGKMPIGMGGSFNLCDVRDLAHGCVAAADKGRIGECYILGNKEVTLKEVCQMLKDACGCKTPLFYVPISMAYRLAAQMEKKAEKTGEKPLMTNFAVYNLARNNEFDYSKAEKELGYHTRPYADTLRDEAQWLVEQGYIEGKPAQPQMPQAGQGVTSAEQQLLSAVQQLSSAAEQLSAKAQAIAGGQEAQQAAQSESKGMLTNEEVNDLKRIFGGRELVREVAKVGSKEALDSLVSSYGITGYSDVMLEECYAGIAMSQDWAAVRDLFEDKDFESCSAKLAAHGITTTRENFDLINDIVGVSSDEELCKKVLGEKSIIKTVAMLQERGFKRIDAQFLETLRENAGSLAADGILTREDLDAFAGKDFYERCHNALNTLMAMSAITELVMRIEGAVSPAFMIAIAGGISLA